MKSKLRHCQIHYRISFLVGSQVSAQTESEQTVLTSTGTFTVVGVFMIRTPSTYFGLYGMGVSGTVVPLVVPSISRNVHCIFQPVRQA